MGARRTTCVRSVSIAAMVASADGPATNLAAADADIFQIPVAKTAQRDKVRLTLTMSDKGGNPTVDETTEARQRNNYSSPDCWRGVVWGGVEHRHSFSFRKG